MRSVSKQQLCKHVPAEANALSNGRAVFSMWVRVTTVALQRCGKHASSKLEAVFSARSVPRCYLEDNWRYSAVEGSIVEC
jgi:hypothetical protein